MQTTMIAMLILGVTILIYFLMNVLYFNYRKTFLLPLLTSSTAIILLLLLFKVPYETYMIGGEWVNFLLGPAVVSLAIPLYKQWELLKQNRIPILCGVFAGVIVGMISGMIFAKMLGFSEEIILTLLPKSITTPVAIQITTGLGGIPSLAPVFVMIAGFAGAILGPNLYKWIKIDTVIGRGIGLGAASHAIGTSKAMEIGEQETSMSSVAMTLSAIIGALIAPFIAWIFYF